MSGDACREKSKTEAQQKAPTFIHAYGWKSEPFCISGDSANVIHLALLATETGGDPMGTGCSRGTRSCLQGLVCYTFCDRRRRKGCRLLVAASLMAPRAADGIGLRTGRSRRLSARGRDEIFEQCLREDFVPAGSQEVYKIPRPRLWRANTFFKNPPFVVKLIYAILK